MDQYQDGRRGRVGINSSPDILAAEAWFRRRGLPWFIDSVDARVRALLRRRWLWILLVVVAVVAVATSAVSHLVTDDWPSAVLIGLAAGMAILLAYAGGPLRVAVIARWAARRALAELDLMLPLVTRALPLLLLFMTFLFINTEVWQVASALRSTRLPVVALVFSAVGVAFLLTRLPQEVREVQETAAGEGIAEACRGTPLEQRALTLAESRLGPDGSSVPDEPLTGTQRANLLLMLLVMQTLQVFLLVFAVFAFFIVFGLLAIHSTVVESWIGHPPSPVVWHLGFGSVRLPVSWELVRVSVFLSSFAGLYFTVYAVTDANYRNQFFGELSRGLEQAVGVREVYRVLLRQSREDPPGAGQVSGAARED
jgi:hypothetical protein